MADNPLYEKPVQHQPNITHDPVGQISGPRGVVLKPHGHTKAAEEPAPLGGPVQLEHPEVIAADPPAGDPPPADNGAEKITDDEKSHDSEKAATDDNPKESQEG